VGVALIATAWSPDGCLTRPFRLYAVGVTEPEERSMQDVVVVGYARTPVGRFGGGLSSLSAMQLGGHAIAGALARSGLAADAVEYVVMGHVLQAGQGQITARQAAVAAGVGMDVASETINKVCLSGMTAIARARDLIRVGDFELVVAGGMESMSTAPYVLDKARFGYRMGDGALIDVMMHDGLTCAFDDCAMGLATDDYQRNKGLDITREQQDEWAARSHERAADAWKRGAFEDEVVPVEVPQRKGDPVTVDEDEGIRPGTTTESLAGLRPAFTKEGTITAGNASQISDGAAALILASRSKAEELGLPILATITSWGTVAGPDPSLHLQPSHAIRDAARRIDVDASGFDLYEINEAFASVAVASARDLGLSEDRVNVNGGGIALGHPIGCSGARIVVSLVNELRRRGGGNGAAALCGGGGQGDALTVHVPA
jgi:acetyl-CoA C-acetyltransferase